ncbi:hypothetical protein [Mesorhizobium sp. KR9-304]|uniref:hypothetical protein n=1 Tax=Mesorhizobium sp. KR9-304 TaxID=3156614 RepID=UPI0032B5CFC3
MMKRISPQLRWNRRHPAAIRAHGVVARAIRRGELQRLPCWICGAAAEAHHEDYSVPLSIDWLCRFHHRRHHDRQPGDLFARCA